MTTQNETQPATPASHQLRQALVAKGYLVLARRYMPPDLHQYRQLDYYANGTGHVLLLEIVEDETGHEVGCELYQPVANTNSIAATIAAIP